MNGRCNAWALAHLGLAVTLSTWAAAIVLYPGGTVFDASTDAPYMQ